MKERLYFWNSTAFSDKNLGVIISIAFNPEDARQKVLNRYKHHPDYQSIMNDVSIEPKIIGGDVIAIYA